METGVLMLLYLDSSDLRYMAETGFTEVRQFRRKNSDEERTRRLTDSGAAGRRGHLIAIPCGRLVAKAALKSRLNR